MKGKRKGDHKKTEKAAIKDKWFEKYGYKIEGEWRHRCLSCGRTLGRKACDFSHKRPAGLGGSGDKGGHVQSDNGIPSCRPCHDWLENGPDQVAARACLIASPASFENDQLVKWDTELWDSLKNWIKTRWHRGSFA